MHPGVWEEGGSRVRRQGFKGQCGSVHPCCRPVPEKVSGSNRKGRLEARGTSLQLESLAN